MLNEHDSSFTLTAAEARAFFNSKREQGLIERIRDRDAYVVDHNGRVYEFSGFAGRANAAGGQDDVRFTWRPDLQVLPSSASV